MSPGDFISLLTAQVCLGKPIRQLTDVNSIFGKKALQRQQVFLSFLDLPEEVDKGHTRRVLKAKYWWRSMSFKYPGADKLALKNITLSLTRGKPCIVGRSGSG